MSLLNHYLGLDSKINTMLSHHTKAVIRRYELDQPLDRSELERLLKIKRDTLKTIEYMLLAKDERQTMIKKAR